METMKRKSLTNLPLLSNQKRMWIMSQQDPFNPAYNLQLTYHFNGELDTELFDKSLNLLFRRHLTMFSVFKQKDGEPFIEILPHEVHTELIDFSEIKKEKRKEKIFSFAGDDSRRSFDIENGPLYRLFLLKENEKSYYFHGTIHHIIFDGWSRRIFVQELSSIYIGLLHGIEDSLNPLTFQSFDHAEFEINSYQPDDELSLTAFWKNFLCTVPVELKLPIDFARKSEYSGLGNRESFEFSFDVTSKLKQLSKENQVSLFNTVLSLVGILFQKYSGENDICIGIPVSGRKSNEELKKIFGLFINTLPVKLSLDGSNSFKNQITKTKNIVKETLVHSALPFEKIVDAIKPERIPGVNPLFQVSLSWLTDLTIPVDFGTVKGERVTLPEGVSPFDITFYIWEQGDIIRGDIEYNIDLFSASTIMRLKDNLLCLAYLLSQDPDRQISEVQFISKNESDILKKFNSTEINVPNCLIHNLFEEQALLTPGNRAVLSGASVLTYRDLDTRSNQLARHLLSLGVKGGDVVGICLERSADMVISVMAVLKSGCCYLPMDPIFPDERIAYMYEDSGARVLISQSSLKDKFIHFPDTTIVLTDTESKQISRNSKDKVESGITNQSLAYMIYTSGSTGKPKGVKVHHEAVVNFLLSMKKKPGIGPDDRLLAVTTLSFDISVLELFLPLSSGAGLIIADTDDIFDGDKLSDLLQKHDITIMQATPATWNILLGNGWNGKKNLRALCGGEAILPGLVSDLLPRVQSLWNMYGPTETTVWSTCKELKDAEPPILVGRPIDNTRIYILDKQNNIVPIGVTGEVCIGGLGVTKGYNNRPELTSEKFIEFGEAGTIYRTGDLGRFLSDGNIELFGRSDNQIKLRGFRIEPGEIESLLSKLPSVKEAVVRVQRFEDNDERLVAFLNTETNFSLSDDEIAGSLSRTLPGYMIPSFFVRMSGFPRLPNGKINKNDLIFNTDESGNNKVIEFESLTPTQKKVSLIWGDILKSKNLNPSKSFFEIGGNSLLAIRVVNKIREEFGVTFSFKSFISNPTILQSGTHIDSQSPAKGNIVELVHLTQTTSLPLTLNQKRLWLISQLEPDKPSYIIRLTYRLSGQLNSKLFEESLDKLFQRHHIVYSVIREINGEPGFEIVPHKVKLSNLDFSELSESEKSDRTKDLFHQDAITPFDLRQGPLYRVYLIKSLEEDYIFHMSIHHIIFDGWSQGVFVNDLGRIYNCLVAGKEPVLEPLEFQQYDYAKWESSNKENVESREFWEKNLQGCTGVLNFPYDIPRSEKKSGKGGIEEIKFTGKLTENLRKISKEAGASLFTTILAGFGLLIKRYSGESDLNIGLPIAYRPHTKLENIFGMFVNTVVVRLKFEKEIAFKELVKQSEEAAMNAVSHQDMHFEKVVEIVKPERIPGANPLFQIAFAWQNNLNVPVNLNGVKSEVIKGHERAAAFDLTLVLWENDGIIEGEIEYNIDILHAETIRRLKVNFLTLLSNLASDINVSVNSVSMICAEDIKKIEEINNNATSYPREKSIAQLFEEMTIMFPENIAISFKGESNTYSQLNNRANQLARTLRNAGVTKNTPVGILTDKSLEMIVGILAILKAGGCYTPIDPGYPVERMNFIVRDSGLKMLLTQEKYMGIKIQSVQKLGLNAEESYENDATNLKCPVDPEDLAYILYTSGTTGVPKGTPISQRGVVRLVCNTNYMTLTSHDRMLFAGAIVFDASSMEIWSALLNGGSLYIIDKETLLDSEVLEREIISNRISHLVITSALFSHLADNRSTVFHNLKYLMVGGDVLSPDHSNKVRKSHPALKLINGYGPTENATMSTYYPVESDFFHRIPIGKPNSNSTAYIFDKDMNYQPVGVPGELFVGGDGLSAGYLNREELNKASFIEHPFKPGVRIYKTGDLVRWLPDWNIDFLGRADNQLKIRGFRIELEEIESVISELDGVIEAVIKPVKVDQGDYRLVAFLNVRGTFSMETDEVLAKVRTRLPLYMIPSAFKIMHGFPTTINGKTDRKALVIDQIEIDKKDNAKNSTISPTGRIIHKIWGDALKTEDISVTDNFFDIGGNSLLAVTVANLIAKEFKIPLKPLMVFEFPTIKTLSEYIAGNTGDAIKTKNTEIDERINSKRNVSYKKLRG